jgi:predicted ATPase
MTLMPSRRRPKAPPPRQLTDVERFAQSLRDSEEADRKAKQDAIDRKTEQARLKLEGDQLAARLQRARAAHQRSVELVKEAKRTGKGAAAADIAWREAKAELLELETGKRQAWAVRPAPATDAEQAADDDSDVEAVDGV